MEDEARVVPLRKSGGCCPICGKPTTPSVRPFCSKRCADIDLGHWLKGTYRVPTDEALDEDAGSPEA